MQGDDAWIIAAPVPSSYSAPLLRSRPSSCAWLRRPQSPVLQSLSPQCSTNKGIMKRKEALGAVRKCGVGFRFQGVGGVVCSGTRGGSHPHPPFKKPFCLLSPWLQLRFGPARRRCCQPRRRPEGNRSRNQPPPLPLPASPPSLSLSHALRSSAHALPPPGFDVPFHLRLCCC